MELVELTGFSGIVPAGSGLKTGDAVEVEPLAEEPALVVAADEYSGEVVEITVVVEGIRVVGEVAGIIEGPVVTSD